MGRQASITLNDVKSARDSLIAENQPHGIIAIRRRIGRGSPQLITKLLAQISAQASDTRITQDPSGPAPEPNVRNIDNTWRRFSAEVESLLTNTHVRANNGTSSDEERLNSLEQLVTHQQQQLERLNTLNHKLGEQLMQQQDLFESWRHEQQAERQMLRFQLEQLSQLASNQPAPRKRRKKGTQLDLYDDSE